MRRTITAALAVAALFAAPVAAQDVFVLTDEFIRPLPVVGTLTTGECIKAKDSTTLEMGECGGGGGGDISGPVSSTDNAISRWDGTAGDTLQDSSVTISDGGDMTLATGDRVLAGEFEMYETDTHDTCSAGGYYFFADTSETKLKKCQNGTVSDVGQAGSIVMVDEFDIEIAEDVTTQRCGATMSCFEYDPETNPNQVEIDADLTGISAPSETELNSASAATRNINQTIPAIYNFTAGNLQIGGRPPLEAPTIKVFCDNYALDSGRRYCSWPTGTVTATSSTAAERMAFPCSRLRTITATFRNPSTGATANYPASNTMTIGFAVDADIPGSTRCTYIAPGGGGAAYTSCDDIDATSVWARNTFVATWINNTGSPASTDQLDVVIQVYCGP